LILPTSLNLSRRCGLVRRGLTVGLGSLLIGSLGATSATAQLSSPARERPPLTLQELLETVNDRPVAPAAEPSVTEPSVTEPSVTEPSATEPKRPESLTPTEATTPAVEQTTEQAEQTEQTVRLRLSLSDRKVYVYRGETLETSYPVAIGRPGWETPTGEYEVYSQLVDPGWTNPLDGSVMTPGPDNPLGDRWIAFWTDGVNEIGFHGTPNRDSVGQAASHGCIRMYNEDVRELYEVVALGTPVIVEP